MSEAVSGGLEYALALYGLGVPTCYLLGRAASFLSKESLGKSTCWKDASTAKKIGYVIFPGIYLATIREKKAMEGKAVKTDCKDGGYLPL